MARAAVEGKSTVFGCDGAAYSREGGQIGSCLDRDRAVRCEGYTTFAEDRISDKSIKLDRHTSVRIDYIPNEIPTAVGLVVPAHGAAGTVLVDTPAKEPSGRARPSRSVTTNLEIGLFEYELAEDRISGANPVKPHS